MEMDPEGNLRDLVSAREVEINEQELWASLEVIWGVLQVKQDDANEYVEHLWVEAKAISGLVRIQLYKRVWARHCREPKE